MADESGAEGTVSIVGVELDPARGGVSWISPIATALLKAQVGDVVTMRTPRGTEELEIIAIRYEFRIHYCNFLCGLCVLCARSSDFGCGSAALGVMWFPSMSRRLQTMSGALLQYFLGSNGGGKSVSPSISRKSISAVRHICEIGTSFAFPSNGFSVLSPTRSSEVYIQEINTLKGMTSQTMFPLITPPGRCH